jgi:hypothetical protein
VSLSKADDLLDEIRARLPDEIVPRRRESDPPDFLELLDRLDDALEDAPHVPLVRDQVRVQRDELLELVDEMRPKLLDLLT